MSKNPNTNWAKSFNHISKKAAVVEKGAEYVYEAGKFIQKSESAMVANDPYYQHMPKTML